MEFIRKHLFGKNKTKNYQESEEPIDVQHDESSSDSSLSTRSGLSAAEPLLIYSRHTIVWFEPTVLIRNNFKDALRRMNQMNAKLAMYTDIEEYKKGVPGICLDSKLFIVLPGMWAQCLLNFTCSSSPPRLADAIFIYSTLPQKYEFLRSEYSDVYGIYETIEETVAAIEHCMDEHCELLRFYDQRATRDLSYESTTAEFVWFILLKNALLHLVFDRTAKNEMLTLCRSFYTEKPVQLGHIKDFEIYYQPNDAPRWFSRSFFLYKLVNRGLRTQNVELLYAFRYFIRDLSSWLHKEFHKIAVQKETFSLYRGAAVSTTDFHSLVPGKLIAPNGYFSTTRDFKVAELFMGSSRSNTIRIMYKIECNMTSYSQDEIKNLACFADISESSLIPDEQEVLFDLGATFEVENVQPIASENGYYLVSLIPSCEGIRIASSYLEIIKDDIKGLSCDLIFGALLCKTNKHKAAEFYLQRLLCNEPDNENLSRIYYYLGWAQMEQCNYGQSATSFERAYDLTPTTDKSSRARILNNIGRIMLAHSLYKEALNYYKKALDLRIEYFGFGHRDVVESLTNISRVYYLDGNYDVALQYRVKSLQALNTVNNLNSTVHTENTNTERYSYEDNQRSSDWFENALRTVPRSAPNAEETNSDMSDSLYEIGSMQWKLGATTTGLENMRRSQSLDKLSRSSSLSTQTSSLGSSGNVSPHVSHDNRPIQYALRCLKEAKINFSTTDVEIADAMEDVAQAYKTRGKFSKALKYYNFALERRQKQKNSCECSLKIAWTLNEIGDVYRALNKLEEALKNYESCFKIRQTHLPPEHNDRQCLIHKIDQVIWQISAANSKSSKTSFVNTSTPNIRQLCQQDKVDLPHPRSLSQQNLCTTDDFQTNRQMNYS